MLEKIAEPLFTLAMVSLIGAYVIVINLLVPLSYPLIK